VTRRRKLLVIAAGALVAVFVVLRLCANGLLWSRIAGSIHDKFGVDVEMDDLSLSLLSGDATVLGVRIIDRGTPLIEAQSVEMSVAVTDLFSGKYDFKKLVVRGFAAHVVVETPESTNMRRVVAGRKRGEGPDDFVRFRRARIVDGSYTVADAVTDPKRPSLLRVHDAAVEIENLQVSGEPNSTEIGDLRLDALLAQDGAAARVSMVAWARPWTDAPTFVMHAAVTGLDLKQMPQYVDDSTRGWLGGDVMHLVATMRAKKGVIEHGAIVGEVVATGTLLPIRFGGAVSDPVFDERSKLDDVFHFGFARLGRVAVIGDVGAGVYGAGESVVDGAVDTFDAMTHLDPLGALTAAGGGVAGAGKSLGKGIVDVVKRLFGSGDSPAQTDEAAAVAEAAFAKLHAKRRAAMLDAALASAANGPAARRKRIEAEIAAAPH